MKKQLRFIFMLGLLAVSIAGIAQTPQWLRDDLTASSGDGGHAITTDASGNTYVGVRNTASGILFVAKLNAAGTILWSDNLDDDGGGASPTSIVDIKGLEIVTRSGTDYLYIGFDSQTTNTGFSTLAIYTYNTSTGARVAGKAYEDYGTDGMQSTSNELSHFTTAPAADETLIFVAEKLILKVDLDLAIISQWSEGADPAHMITTVDILSYGGTDTSPDFSGTDANATTDMPFFTGSPLANTQAPTDAGYVFPAENDFTFGGTDGGTGSGLTPIPAMTSSTAPWADGTNFINRGAVETSEGLYVHFTFTESSNSTTQQGIIKLNKANNYTVEWSKYWRQSANVGGILADENNNVYLYSWDELFYFESTALDMLANKFDEDGNILWSKTYGAGGPGSDGGGGNEVIWTASAVDIDQANQEIVMSFYTDSYNSGTPSSILLSTNYDGNIQNYTFTSDAGSSIVPKGITTDGSGNAYAVYDDLGGGPVGVFKVNTATVFLAPTMASATKDSDSQITVTFSKNVQTNEGNATDFTVTDGSGSTFAVSSQVDGTAGDTEIALTVANLSTALGDLTVTYNNANNEISDAATGTEFTATDATGVVIDLDADAPTLSTGTKDSDTQLTITFSEAVQTNEMNPTDFIVMDASPTAFAVSAQVDGTAKDTDIVLTVANLSGATLPLTVTYTNANGEISDFGGNELATDATGIDIQQLITWDGETSSDWGTATNWDGDVLPISSDAIAIPDVTNDPVITSDVEVNSIDIQTGAMLTITSNSLKVTNATTLDGSMSVASGASFVPLGSISGAGSATINRNTTFGVMDGQYSVIGSPITMGSTSSLGSIVYSYDETIAYDPGGTDGGARFVAVSTPETMSVGDAYFSANTGDISFTGTPNSGNIDVALVYDETNDGVTDAGFNLVSNPYTAAISYDDFAAGNTDFNGTIYLWDDGDSQAGQRTNTDYVTATSMGTASGGSNRSASWDGYIRSTQGFIVKATSAGTLHFTPSMMDIGNNSDAGYFRTAETKPLRFSLSSSKMYNDILIGFRENATDGFDKTLDAYKIKGNRNLQFYSRMNESIMAIQALPILEGEVTIDLGFDVSEAGTYTLELENPVRYGFEVYLKDNLLDKMIDLSESNNYSFESKAVQSSDRFSLIFSPSQILSIDDKLNSDQLIVFSNNNQVTLRMDQPISEATVKIYDLSGSVVQQFTQVDFDGSDWNTSLAREGLFIVTVQAQGQLLVKKFFK